MSDFLFGTGYIQSELDGTEHIFNVDDKVKIPEEFSWKDSMVKIGDQGSSSTCVCWSSTAVMNFLVNAENGTPNFDNNFDINKLYSIRANKNAEGMTFKEILHYYRHTGANGYKINSYAMVGSEIAAKFAILSQGPILAGLPVYNSGAYFWRKNGRNFYGGHAICLVGWDKDSFILRNSWGTSWGDGGYSYLGFDEFSTAVMEAWTMLL